MTDETKTRTYQGCTIPARMMPAINAWIAMGDPPGDFLWAVICNDLKGAVARADHENLRNLPAFVGYFYNEAPAACWGSEGNARAWRYKCVLNAEARGSKP